MPLERQLSDKLSLAVESFYSAKEGERIAPRTLEVYRYALDAFGAWLRAHEVTKPESITPALVRQYFADLGKRELASSTVHNYARPVKTFLRFLYADDLLPTDVMARVKMPRVDKRILPAFTPESAKAILEACATPRETALCLFMLDTGLRAAELCALKIGNYDAKTGAAFVRHGKGGKDRIVYAGAKARRAVLRYMMLRENLDDHAPLFPSERSGKPLTPSGLLIIIRNIGKRAGVDHCHPHTFRRTFALWSFRAGMDVMRLAALMGHSDLTVLRRYLDLNQSDLQAAQKEHGAVDNTL